jgi:hypothetical protein
MDSFIINDTDHPGSRVPAEHSCVDDAALEGERIAADVKDADLIRLEDTVRELIGSEPKDFARAALLIYDIFRLHDEHEKARQVARMFDLPAMVLFQVPPLVRTIDRMDHASPSPARDRVLERIDDLNRLVIMALDGDANVAIVRRLLDLREVVSQTRGDRARSEEVPAPGDDLIHLVNAFFFDRLTSIPAMRDYVVGLELGV